MSEAGEATRPFTKVNLRDVKDSAVAFGFSETQEGVSAAAIWEPSPPVWPTTF